MPKKGLPRATCPVAWVRARMPTGGIPTSKNCLVRAECRPWLGGMQTGRNAEYSHNVYPSTLFTVRSAITATAELLVRQ